MAGGKNCYIVNCGSITPTKQQMGEGENHGAFAHNVGGGTGQVGRVPGVQDAPKLQLGVNRQMWNEFMTRWELFKTLMGVDGATATSWLFHCLDTDLGDMVIAANPGTDPRLMTEAALIACIKELAMDVDRKLVQRIKMGELQQKPGVNVLQYLDALRGQARQCQYEVKTLLEMVEFITSQEQASLGRSQVGVERDDASVTKQSIPTTSQKRCSYCQGESHGAITRLVRREKCPAWGIQCTKCYVRGHYGKACYKCHACGQWGHKSKISKWCQAKGGKQFQN